MSSSGYGDSGAGGSNGSAGSIHEAGGVFGKLEAARESEYFHKLAKNDADEIKKRIAEMNEYFNQYLDEYYEEDIEEEKEDKDFLIKQNEILNKRKNNKLINFIQPENLVNFLREKRVKDIVCIQVPFEKTPQDYVVICSPHNSRHAESVMENIRTFIKDNYKYEENVLPTKVEKPGEWYTIDMRRIILHMMTEKMRSRYDLELLYGVGDEELSDTTKDDSKKNEYKKFLDIEDDGLRPQARL